MKNQNESQILDLLFKTFQKMCDFIETHNEIGCAKCPVRQDCILKGNQTDFKYFKSTVESVKKKLEL